MGLLLQYYSRALSSQWGQKVKAFYTTTSKQVLDIHEEARRIASQDTSAHQDASHPDTGVSTAVGTTAPPLDPAVHTIPEKTTEAPLVP